MVQGQQNYAFQDETPMGQNVKLQAFTSTNDQTILAEISKIATDTETHIDIKSKGRRCWNIIIEPSMILGITIEMSFIGLFSQYVYYAIGEKYNLTAVMEAEKRNMTNGSSEGESGSCGGDVHDQNSTVYDLQQQTQAESAVFLLYIEIITGVPGLFFSLFFGRVMDQIGRKPALILSLSGLVLRTLVYILQQVFHLPLEVILFAGVIEAVTGGLSVFMAACYTVISDSISIDGRTKRMTIVDMLTFAGFGFVSFAIGVMIQNLGFLWPFVLIMAAHTLCLVYVISFVHETGQKASTSDAISPKYIIDLFKVVLRKREGNKRKLLLLQLLASLISYIALKAYNLDTLYLINSPFCLSPSLIGFYFSYITMVSVFVQILFIAFLMHRLNDTNITLVSLVSWEASALMFATATNITALWAVPVVGCLNTISGPLIRAAISKLLPANEQGSVFAFLTSMAKIMGIGASAMYNNVYAATLYVYKGTAYLMMGGFIGIAFVLIVIFKVCETQQERLDKAVNEKSVQKEDRNSRF